MALLLVLGVGTAMLGVATWGAARLGWMHRATRAVWDRVALDFAAVEVEHAARAALWKGTRESTTAVVIVTANRSTGRWEITPVSPDLWRIRWGVTGAEGQWRVGAWLAVRQTVALDAVGTGAPILLPGLPPAR
ncbi:MAG: hypothetical protein ACO3F5_00970 [Gemmatimonadaceae bacterium]